MFLEKISSWMCTKIFVLRLSTKNKKYSKSKKWHNKKVCYERRHYKCKYNKVADGCRQKNCCLTITFEGKVLSQKCRNHNVRCPFIYRRKCSLQTFKNGCHRKQCCGIFQKGKKVTKKCRHGKLKCPSKTKTKCKTRKGKNCSTTKCCKFKFVQKLNFWKKVKASCSRDTKCATKKNRMQMEKNWK